MKIHNTVYQYDQYDSADSGGYEVRDETGSDPDLRDVSATVHTFGSPPKTFNKVGTLKGIHIGVQLHHSLLGITIQGIGLGILDQIPVQDMGQPGRTLGEGLGTTNMIYLMTTTIEKI